MENVELFQKTVVEKEDFIFIKPLCDFFGIDYDNQVRRLNNDRILQFETSKKTDETLFGDKRPRLAVTRRGFLRWIQTIPVSIIQVTLRKKFEDYQISIFDYMYESVEEKVADKKQAVIDYARLKKLKRLHAIISKEIQRVKAGFNTYIENTFVQQKINFDQNLKSL